MSRRRMPNFISQLQKIDVEDLQYVERDLCFYELVSLGFLLFGAERANAEFVLQKLLVLSRSISGAPAKTTGVSSRAVENVDLLRKYASINPGSWRSHLVEALAIIDARRVLRKLGFQWEALRQHYLPHIAELSLHIHPLLKALYKMCERMTPVQAGQLVLEINEQHQRQRPRDHLRFYDFAYLEIFLLDWLTRRIISLGDADANGANVHVLLDYLKLNELDALKMLLVGTINQHAERPHSTPAIPMPTANMLALTVEDTSSPKRIEKQPDNKVLQNGSETRTSELEVHECYTVRRENAGFLLIINQKNFYEETSEEFKHLLPPRKLNARLGTDEDNRKLVEVFTSFGYKPVECENLNHIDMQHQIREIVKRSLFCDSLIVCILSHGIDGAVYGSNSIPVEISAIEQIITAEALLGKPKMLIVQACQKDEEPPERPPERKKKQAAAPYIKPDAYGDYIKAMSTVPGYVSMRHTKTGTWFIQALCDAVHNLGDRKHMLDILIAVHRDVTNKRGDKNEIMVPTTSNTLTKYFFLPKRNS